MKLRHVAEMLGGVLLTWCSWYVYTAGRVIGRGGFTAMTRETHPSLFWIELLSLAIVGALLSAYGIAGMAGFGFFRQRLNDTAGQVRVVKVQLAILGIALLGILVGLAWLVITELVRK